MSIRKRSWTTAKGEQKEAWVVDYFDQAKTRRLKTFEKKRDAIAFEAATKVEIKQGVHTPESESPTVSGAAAAWLYPNGIRNSVRYRELAGARTAAPREIACQVR